MSFQEEKKFDPRDRLLQFVDGPDDLDPYSDEEEDGSLRAKMSCGHAVTPQTLTECCRSQLNQGQYQFKCPARNEDTQENCGALWSYQEVRRMAELTPEEMQHFEETIAIAKYCEFKTCPGCQTYVERDDPTNLSVQCTVCTADMKRAYEFCWQCMKPWKGHAPRSDRCDNEGCIDHDLEVLQNCDDINLPEVQGVDSCPSIRACPTCGQRVEHDRTGCKNITCSRCQIEFCFVCLKLTPVCLETSSYFIPCSDGVAPRQTYIPVWHKD